MKYFNYETKERIKEIFYKEPEAFSKYTNREVLSNTLGATLYMPATKESIAKDVIEKKYKELTSMVIDLEDAVADNHIQEAEEQLLKHLQTIYSALETQTMKIEDLPLIFIRVREPEQMRRLTLNIQPFQQVLTGYVFPKFSYKNGKEYLEILEANNNGNSVLYGMPILESSDIIYKESRMETLLEMKNLLDSYKKYILNVRVGATDFCGLFGIRRKADTTIYDVSVIRDCLTDIINVFNRQEDGYVISGPVWEFFSKEQRILKPKLRMSPFKSRYGRTGLQKRTELINEYIDGLINEVLLDKLNGFIGKTVIHPTHMKAVHSLYTVTHEEYMDAMSIIANSEGQEGVLKSQYENKMNEMKPHFYWAKRILMRAQIYGVFNEEQDFTSLLMESQQEKMVHEVIQ